MRSPMRFMTAWMVVAVLLPGCGRRPGNPALPNVAIAPADDALAVPGDPDQQPPGAMPGARARAGDGPPLKSFQELLVGLPKDKLPKLGPEAIIERNEAKEWLTQNAVGKVIEFTVQVHGIDIQDSGDGRYTLDLLLATDPKAEETKRLAEGIKVDRIKVADVPCQVIMHAPSPLWQDLDTATARKYRDLKKKHTVLQVIIDEAEFQEAEGGKELILRIRGTDAVPVIADTPLPAKKEENGK